MTRFQTASRKDTAFRRRQIWWSHPAFIALFAALTFIGAGVIFGLRSLGYTYVDVTFAFFWGIMLVGFVVMYRASVSSMTHRIDNSFVVRQEQEIAEHRLKTRNDFLETELERVGQGVKTPVLDVWRLDPGLQKRHPYFSCLDGVYVDPKARELQIRVQIDRVEQSDGVRRMLIKDGSEFFRVLAGDASVRPLRRFFNSIIVTVYSLRQDEHQMDVPYPVLSVKVPLGALQRIVASGSFDLALLGEVRVAHGAEIVPFCDIESANQLKGK